MFCPLDVLWSVLIECTKFSSEKCVFCKPYSPLQNFAPIIFTSDSEYIRSFLFISDIGLKMLNNVPSRIGWKHKNLWN